LGIVYAKLQFLVILFPDSLKLEKMKKIFQHKLLYTLLVLSVIAGTMASCEKSSTKSENTSTDLSKVKTYLYSIMSSIYYWSSSIPSVNANNYDDIYKYFDALLVSNDRWSWMMDAAEYNSMQNRHIHYLRREVLATL
jgi:hypothetical protein